MLTETVPQFQGLTLAHATALAPEEQPAFAHAVALAKASRSKLISLHANDDPAALSRMPTAAALLASWGELPADAKEGDEASLGMAHARRIDSCCDDAVDTLLSMVREASPQLVIGTTHGREGLARAMLGSISEAIALQTGVPSLLFPVGGRSFVDETSGRIKLQRMLVAAGDSAAANLGALYAAWLGRLAGASQVEVELLHVDDGTSMPSLHPPADEHARYSVKTVVGGIEAALLREAEHAHCDALVLATRGHDSLLDVLLGSHAERVLRRSACPVLSIPLP